MRNHSSPPRRQGRQETPRRLFWLRLGCAVLLTCNFLPKWKEFSHRRDAKGAENDSSAHSHGHLRSSAVPNPVTADKRRFQERAEEQRKLCVLSVSAVKSFWLRLC